MSNDRSVTRIEQQRKQLFESMTEKTQAMALDFEKKKMHVERGLVLVHYDMGVQLMTATDKDEDYGTDPIAQIAEWMDLGSSGKTQLYDMRTFAATFDRDFVKEESTKLLTNGKSMTYAHFRCLMRLKDAATRTKLLKQVRTECLSASELENMVRSGESVKNVRRGGRHHIMPTNPLAGLQKGFSETQRLYNYLEKFEECVLEALDKTPVEDLEERHLEQLQIFADQAVKTAQRLEQAQRDMVPVEKRIRTLIEKRDEGGFDEDAEFSGGDEEAPETTVAAPARKKKKKKRPVESAAKTKAGSTDPARKKKKRPQRVG